MSESSRLHDDDRLPFGTFKGKRLGDVPGWWWQWFAKQPWCETYPDLVEYANLLFEDEDR